MCISVQILLRWVLDITNYSGHQCVWICQLWGYWLSCEGVVRPEPYEAKDMQSRPSRFDAIIRPSPDGAGQTTPGQPGHYSLHNTKLANARYSHGNSCRIALIEPPAQLSCYWKSREHCHPFFIWLIAIARNMLNEGYKLTSWIWCICLQLLNPCLGFCFLPNGLL